MGEGLGAGSGAEDVLVGVVGDPSRFRARFQEDAAADYPEIRAALLESLKAEKEVRTTCPACSKAITVSVRDNAAVNKAVELYTTLPYGRVGTDSGPSPEEERAQEVMQLTGEELFERRARWFAEYLTGVPDEERARVLDTYGLSVATGVERGLRSADRP